MSNQITKEMCIGEVIDRYPETAKVFEKYFGQGCFTCPGSRMENIAFGATMHGMEADTIIDELNKVLVGN